MFSRLIRWCAAVSVGMYVCKCASTTCYKLLFLLLYCLFVCWFAFCYGRILWLPSCRRISCVGISFVVQFYNFDRSSNSDIQRCSVLLFCIHIFTKRSCGGGGWIAMVARKVRTHFASASSSSISILSIHDLFFLLCTWVTSVWVSLPLICLLRTEIS